MKKIFNQIINHLTIIPFVILFCYPLLWLITACFKTNKEIYQPLNLLPKEWNFQYLEELLDNTNIPFWEFWSNSLIVTTSQALLALFLSSSVAYYFIFIEGKFKKTLFVIAISLILIPCQILIFPLRELVFKMNLNDHLLAVILPGSVSGIGVIYFIQVYRHFPRDYIDMARMEGASETRVYLSTVPLLFSAFLSCFIIHFLFAWQMHLIPLQLLNKNQLLPLGISSLFTSSSQFNMAVIMNAGVFCILPVAIIFLLSYKRFRSSLSENLL